MRRHIRSILIAASFTKLMAPAGLHAATKYWDGTDTTANADGGSGSWTGSGLFWDSAVSGGTSQAWADNDDAIFGGATGTVTLTNTRIAQSLTFNTTGYIITGTTQTLTLAGTNPFINTATGVTATISSILAGTTAWSKTGAGTLILTNTGNTNAAATTVSAGTLQLGAAGVVAGATALTVASGATFDLNNFAETIGSLSGAGNITLGTGTLTTGGANTSTTFSGVISESGGLIKTGTGTLTLSGNNTYTGATAIQNGALSVTSLNSVAGGATSGSLGDPGSVANGTLALGAGSAAGTLIYTGAGETTDRVINLAGTSGGGVLDQSGTGALKFTSAFTATGAGAKTLTLQGSTAGTGEIAGAIVNNSGANTTAVTKAGTGTWVLSGNNTYTGATTISAGVLNIRNAGGLGTGGAVSIASGAALELEGGISVSAHALTLDGTGIANGGALRNISGNNTWSGAITLPNVAAVYRINSDAGLLTLSGTIGESGTTDGKNLTFGGAGNITSSAVISGTGSDIILTKDGTGTLTLTAINTFNGGTVISAGTVKLTGSGRLANTAINVNGGTLDYGTITDTVGAITLTSGTIASTTGVLTGSSYAVQSGTISAILGGTGGMTKTTAGTVVLSGANTRTGVTTITAGTLSVGTIGNGGVSGNLGAAAVAATNLVLGGGTLQYTGATASTNRNFTLTASTTSTIEVTNAATTLTVSGASTATTGALTKSGAGTLVLAGANLHTGTTTVSAGTLAYGANNALSSGAVTVNGGTLALATFSDTVGAVTLTSGAITGSTGVLTGTSYTTNSGTISAILAGAAALTQNSGTTTLSGTNTFTGATTVASGTLQVTSLANGGTASALGASTNTAGNLKISGGATLAYVGAANTSTDRSFSVTGDNTEATIANDGTGTVDFSNAGGTVGYDTATQARTIALAGTNTGDNVFRLKITDNNGAPVTLKKLGAGKWTMTGANTFSGATSVSAGTLLVNGSNTASAVTVESGATFGGSGTVGAITLKSGATLSPGAAGAGSLGTLNAGALVWNGGGTLKLDLGAAGTSDKVAISGIFSKGTAGGYLFDFNNTGSVGSYTLVTANSISGFTATDFSFANLGAGLTGNFVVNTGTVVINVTVIPESGYAVGAGALAALLAIRRRRKKK